MQTSWKEVIELWMKAGQKICDRMLPVQVIDNVMMYNAHCSLSTEILRIEFLILGIWNQDHKFVR